MEQNLVEIFSFAHLVLVLEQRSSPLLSDKNKRQAKRHLTVISHLLFCSLLQVQKLLYLLLLLLSIFFIIIIWHNHILEPFASNLCWCHGPYGHHVAWHWCGQSGVLRILDGRSAALALPAWLPWLGATSWVRGQFGVTSGSNVLPNKAAGPRDRVRPVSWQRALPPTPKHGSGHPGGDWDRRAPFSFHQVQFICSYKLARTN